VLRSKSCRRIVSRGAITLSDLMNDSDSEQPEDGEEWNAYFVAPMLLGCGVGVIFGALFAMGKSNYVGLIVAGVGVCIALAGLALSYQLDRGADASRSDK
jgi:hypothetical protein